MNAWLATLAGFVALSLGIVPAWGQKKYDPGATDTTIRSRRATTSRARVTG